MPFSPWSMRLEATTTHIKRQYPLIPDLTDLLNRNMTINTLKNRRNKKKDTSQLHRLITHQIRTMHRQHSHVHTKQRGVFDVWLICIEGNTLHIEETEGNTYAQNIQHIDQTQIKFASHKCTLSRVTNVAKVWLVGLGGTRCLVCVWCVCVCVPLL